MTTDPPDLRTLAAEAIPYKLISTPAVGIGSARRLKLADAVLSAVLPAHRAMVLAEAVQAIEDITGSLVCDWTKGEALASIQDLAVAEPDTAEENPVTLRARSCPTCHSTGERRVIDYDADDAPVHCQDLWHIEVREPERAGRFEECCRGLTDGWCALPIGHAGSCDPTVEARDTHFWTKIAALAAERAEARDLIRRYEGTDNDSKLTYAELESERDRLAVDLYRAQDCGHDLDAFQRQAEELARLRERLDVAQADELAEVRRERDLPGRP